MIIVNSTKEEAMARWSLRSLFRVPARLKSFKLIVFFIMFLVLFLLLLSHRREADVKIESRPKRTLTLVSENIDHGLKTGCSFHTCFDINQCAMGLDNRIGVYVYEQFEYTDSKGSQSFVPVVSDEYSELLAAIKRSKYYEPDFSKACVFVPSLDTLSQSRLDAQLASVILNSQPG